MSADNGIYIAKFSDGYRVAELQAVENLSYLGPASEKAKAYQFVAFKDSSVYKTEDLAIKKAIELAKTTYTEYGICMLEFKHRLKRFSDKKIKKLLW